MKEVISEKCRATAEALSGKTVYIVHHWDTDGIASAALLLRMFQNRVVGFSPPAIGFYSSDSIKLPENEYEALVVVDYGIDGSDYDRLRNRLKHHELLIFDHHHVKPPISTMYYCNPVAYGSSENECPSTSFLLYTLLGEPSEDEYRILAALGIVGDLAPFIDSSKPHPGIEIAEKLLAGTRLDLKALRKIVDLVDSCYRILDRECILKTVRAASENPKELREEAWLHEARIKAEYLLQQALGSVEETYNNGPVKVYKLAVDAYVTSYVGRRLSAKNPENIVVLVHYMPSQKRGFIYVRSMAHRLDRVIDALKNMGVKVGGKTNVLVVEYTAHEEENLVKILLKTISDILRA